uniref:Uncharacterized protein n=1 Tax=candidate division WOR-3 bacterium TaxID=2052148 RepID=A0A7C6E996_UNCW3
MTERIWLFLPNFLKGAKGVLYHIVQAIGYALDEVFDYGKLLKARLMANRLSGFPEYYASDDRKIDLVRLGVSRFLFKRDLESWNDFEIRLQEFPTDVKDFGTAPGLKREIERTGLTCDIVEELWNDIYRWILLALADMEEIEEAELSHLFALGDEDPNVRGTRIYSLDDSELFSFVVYLSGTAEYSKNEVREIIKFVKPAYTKCYCFFPNYEIAEVII